MSSEDISNPVQVLPHWELCVKSLVSEAMQKTDAIMELIDRNLFPPWIDKQTSLSCLSAFACDRHLANWLTVFFRTRSPAISSYGACLCSQRGLTKWINKQEKDCKGAANGIENMARFVNNPRKGTRQRTFFTTPSHRYVDLWEAGSHCVPPLFWTQFKSLMLRTQWPYVWPYFSLPEWL